MNLGEKILSWTKIRRLYEAWIKIGEALGWVNTRIILGLVYFLMITPTGFVVRRLRAGNFRSEYDRNAVTYLVRSEEKVVDHFTRPY